MTFGTDGWESNPPMRFWRPLRQPWNMRPYIWSASRLDCHTHTHKRPFKGRRNPLTGNLLDSGAQCSASLVISMWAMPDGPTVSGRYPASGAALQSCPALALQASFAVTRCGLPLRGTCAAWRAPGTARRCAPPRGQREKGFRYGKRQREWEAWRWSPTSPMIPRFHSGFPHFRGKLKIFLAGYFSRSPSSQQKSSSPKLYSLAICFNRDRVGSLSSLS